MAETPGAALAGWDAPGGVALVAAGAVASDGPAPVGTGVALPAGLAPAAARVASPTGLPPAAPEVGLPAGLAGSAVGVAAAPASGVRDAVVVDGAGRVVGLQRDASEDAALSELVPAGFLALSSDARDLLAGAPASASLADLLALLLDADAPVHAVALDAGGAAPWSAVAF